MDGSMDSTRRRLRRPLVSAAALTCLALAASITPVVEPAPAVHGSACPQVALFVASTAPAPRGDDSFLGAVEDRLPGCVSTVSDESITAARAEAADLVIISSSVVTTVLRDRLVDVGTPILVAEPYLFDDMSLTARNGRELTGQTALQVTDASHPLAGGLSGFVAVYQSPARMNYAFGAASGVEPVASSAGSSQQLTIFGFEAGSQLTDRTAAGARVAFFPSYGVNLTADGETLVHAAMDWLLGQSGVGSTDGDAIAEDVDNCPFVSGEAVNFNILQFDTDRDAIGDTCDLSPTARSTGGFSFVSNHGNLSSSAVGLADVDHDGDLDAFVTNQDVGQPSRVWFNDGTRQFSDSGQTIGSGGALWVELGDIDIDGDVDAAISTVTGVQVWFNDGNGIFSDSGQRLGEESLAFLGDVDGDGDLDMFSADGIPADGVNNRIWINDGTGSFTDSGQRLGTAGMGWVGFGDLDVDGDLDAFVSGNGDNRVWINDGRGVFTDSGQRLSVGNVWALGLDLGDIDGDGDLDAFVTTHVRNSTEAGIPDQVWLNDGAGVFTDSGQRLDGDADVDVALGDLDGDGDLDAFTASNSGALSDRVWINDGTGNFTDSGQVGLTTRSQGVALGDLDADRDLDAFVANWWGDDTLWINEDLPMPPAGSAALLVAGSTAPPLGDRDIAGLIRNAGLDLTIVDDDSDLASIDPSRYAVIFISTSVVPTKVGDVFKDAPVPVVLWEGYLFDDMGLSASGETPTVSTDITIVDSSNPLAASLPAGNVRVYTDAQKLSYGAPAAAADIVATAPSQPNRAVIFSYDTGDRLVDGSAAPGPRVALFPNYLGAQRLTTDGRSLISSAIDWAVAGPRPGNDDFENRFTATVGAQYGTNAGATIQPDERALGESSVWWRWTAPFDGAAQIDTNGSNFDTILGVWSGEELATLTLLASDDDGGEGAQSAVALPVTAGTDYQIAVYSYWYEGGSTPGSVQLNIGSVGPPANDDFADRIEFVEPSVSGVLTLATLEPDEPSPSVDRTPTGSIWWTWTAPADLGVTIYDGAASILAVWSGDSLETLVEIDSNDGIFSPEYGSWSEVNFVATAGSTYQIAAYQDLESSGVVTLDLSTWEPVTLEKATVDP